MSARRVAAALVAVALVHSLGTRADEPSPAAAVEPEPGVPVEACSDGRERNLDTAGHCCWPRQAWSRERNECVGLPRCPAPLRADGEGCVVEPPPSVLPMQPPIGAITHVVIEPRFEGDHFDVRIDDGPACATPCDLNLVPGRHRVVATGPTTIAATVELPISPARLVVRRRDPRRIGISAAVFAVGVVAVAIGASLFIAGEMDYGRHGDLILPGSVLLAGGGAPLILGGLFLLDYAPEDLVLEQPTLVHASVTPSRTRLRLVSAGVAPVVGGGAMAATFAF